MAKMITPVQHTVIVSLLFLTSTLSFAIAKMGNCTKEQCALQTGRMQKLCAGVMHYASQCTGHQLGPIGIFEELECTETDFRLDNIDKHSLNHTQCGTHKCFYRSRHDPKIGYVVVPYGQPTTDVHWLLTELYPYATRLAATYHIRHGLVAHLL